MGRPGAGNSDIVRFGRDSADGVLCGDCLCEGHDVDFADLDDMLISAFGQRACTFDAITGESMQTIDPRDTSDVYAGSGSGDVLWDGKGNDVLTGGLGGDIYIFQRGDGHDVISERGGFSFGPGYLPVGWRRGVVKVNMRAAVNHNRASGKRGVVLRNSNQEIAA